MNERLSRGAFAASALTVWKDPTKKATARIFPQALIGRPYPVSCKLGRHYPHKSIHHTCGGLLLYHPFSYILSGDSGQI